MPPGLLAQLVHPVPERVPVDAEPVGGLAPAAAGVEQRSQRLQQPGVRGGGTEDAGDERLECSSGEAQEQLERAEILIRRDGAGDRVECGPRLEQAATEACAGCGAADSYPGAWCGVDHVTGDRERVLLEIGRDEERRAVAP